jgi:hypothetical protein
MTATYIVATSFTGRQETIPCYYGKPEELAMSIAEMGGVATVFYGESEGFIYSLKDGEVYATYAPALR